jgi:hypothetical protein
MECGLNTISVIKCRGQFCARHTLDGVKNIAMLAIYSYNKLHDEERPSVC